MANCSIPNSTPATGRTSTLSSRRLKNASRASASFLEALGLTNATLAWTLRFFNVQRPTLNAQRSIQIIGRWMLDVGRWTFSSSWRVKGAWWPSRSSKPPSSRLAGRDRFDSYPLRLSTNNPEGGDLHVACANPQADFAFILCRVSVEIEPTGPATSFAAASH